MTARTSTPPCRAHRVFTGDRRDRVPHIREQRELLGIEDASRNLHEFHSVWPPHASVTRQDNRNRRSTLGQALQLNALVDCRRLPYA